MLPLKWEKSPHKSPLARARGLGASHDAVGHWTMQRLTAFANIPLALWMMWAVLQLQGATYNDMTAWLGAPQHAIPAVLFIISSFYHAAIGLQVVIEDYVHSEGTKIVVLWLIKLGLFALATASVFSILQIA